MASAAPAMDPDKPAPGGQPVSGRGDPCVKRFDAAVRDRHPQPFDIHRRPLPDAIGDVQLDSSRFGIHRGAETR